MRKETITCDGCGAQKKETNHWFMVLIGPTMAIVPSDFGGNLPNSNYESSMDLCGASCVLKKVSEFLGSKS